MLFTGSFAIPFFTQVPIELFFQFGLDFLFAGSYQGAAAAAPFRL